MVVRRAGSRCSAGQRLRFFVAPRLGGYQADAKTTGVEEIALV